MYNYWNQDFHMCNGDYHSNVFTHFPNFIYGFRERERERERETEEEKESAHRPASCSFVILVDTVSTHLNP